MYALYRVKGKENDTEAGIICGVRFRKVPILWRCTVDCIRSGGDSVTATNNLISYLSTNLTILLPVFPVYSLKLALDRVMLLNRYA